MCRRSGRAEATRANVSICGVDPRGRGGLSEEGIEVLAFPDDPSLGINPGSLWNEARLGQDSLRVLAAETGGVPRGGTNMVFYTPTAPPHPSPAAGAGRTLAARL